LPVYSVCWGRADLPEHVRRNRTPWKGLQCPLDRVWRLEAGQRRRDDGFFYSFFPVYIVEIDRGYSFRVSWQILICCAAAFMILWWNKKFRKWIWVWQIMVADLTSSFSVLLEDHYKIPSRVETLKLQVRILGKDATLYALQIIILC
jgi:hypothetical protein